ncbi:hypothetical protein TM7_0202 [candidate division TM7 genomosp. GTL1]|nr:hypothetical protein TM7_0202 [candidate division TM7 genomosp. GTL1]
MRYHYQRGAIRPKRRLSRLKLGVILTLLLLVVGYGGFLSVLPGIGGWPLRRGDETAKRVRSTAPGADGNRLYIPKLNVAVAVAAGGAELEGEIGEGKSASLTAEKLQLAFTPDATLEESPFSRLSHLKEGDEIFIDYNGTRFAYSVTTSGDSGMRLETTDKSVQIKAKSIGVVAWNDGAPRIETIVN